VEPADIVTLDRVICCYGDMPALVAASVSRARRLYGVIYPVDRWWTRLGGLLINVLLTVFRQRFRFHVHATASVDSLVRAAGFRPILARRGLLWQTFLYRRVAA